MVGRGWLISGVIIILAILARSDLQEVQYDNTAAPPRSICSGDLSFTKGYKCEDYDVITEDGYILRLFRFREGRTKKSQIKMKQSVLLQHGLLVDGQSWFALSHADQCLPLILVEQGYDVWIANTRGTMYSRQHVSSKLTSSDYWDFTFSEMGKYDLPANLNFVYQQTGQKVHYIGHSQIAGAFGLRDVNVMIEPFGTMIRAFCAVQGSNCFELIYFILGSGQNCCLNSSTIELWLKVQPQATPIKNLVHWAQGVRKHVFGQYDYGNPATNLEHYGLPEAPSYNLKRIPKDLPLFLIYGGQDWLSIRKDVHILLNILRSYRSVRELYVDYYAHLDFIQGITAKDVVYPDIVSFIQGIP
ncbi:triacylglycerol lipase 2-like isoform X2 [Apium graveolens]|uniref:triacylglycerol lipase 2-like isoform X2 n=1 Tax=Apium graveolens TaxID=4045 RepID=UPI003D79E757